MNNIIELKIKGGKDILLSAVHKNDANGQFIYELIDKDSKVYAVIKLNGSTFAIIDNLKDIDESDPDLNEKLNKLALEILEKDQQEETEDNEGVDDNAINPYNPEDIRVNQKQFSIRLIKELIDSKDIDISPDFQREYVWNSVQKSRLIESLLLRIPLPVFYFSEDKEGRLTVVDGLQRLTTIKEFMDNKFELKNLEYLSDEVIGRYYTDDASKKKRGIGQKYYRWFNMTQFVVNVIDPFSPAKVKYDIFKRINTGGNKLNNQEIRNCLSTSNVRDLLKQMVTLAEFVSATDKSLKATRMKDQEMALRYLLFYDAYVKDPTLETSYDGYMESSLDNVVEQYKDITPDTTRVIVNRFSNAMKNAEYLFGKKYAFRKVVKDISESSNKPLLNKALFEAWAVLLSDIPFITVQRNYPEKYMLNFFADMLSADNQLMFYLSYGTNGKANMKYVFRKTEELIKNKIICNQ